MTQRSHVYQRIADDLEADILHGRLAAGAALPSENELIDRYQASRTSVRRAMLELRSAGLVITEQGRRTIVRPKPHIRQLRTRENYLTRRMAGTGNWNAEMQAQGQQPNQVLREVGEVPAPHDVAARLLIDEGAPVIVRRRLFEVEGVPAQTYDTYYALAMAAGTRLAEAKPVPGGAHQLIEDPHGPINRRIARFVEDVTARMPTEEESAILKLAGSPVVRVIRTAYDIAGEPVEVVDEVMSADLHEFRYVIDI